ncbi:MAG: InlB B-repeat-containing protein [Oscillospiraceae bacterium]
MLIRKKKWLAILVTVAMVCTMLPMTAFAANETYQVWVGGVQVTSDNAADVLGDSGSVIYNPSTSTLTLNNANITGGYEENYYFYGIRADGALNIVLTGTNTVTATAGTNCTVCYGIWVHDGLNVSGNGTLTVTASEAASANTGITAFGVTIDGSTVTATGGAAQNTSTGINSSQSINITGNSHVTATGIGTAMNVSRGIKATYDVTFNSGSVVDATGGLYGIDAGSIITLKAGSSGTATATATSSSTATAMNKSPKRDSGLVTAGAYNEQTMRWGEAAVDKYNIWIKGIQVTTLNQNDVLGDSGSVKYDSATSTLTLNGANISGSYKGGTPASAAIYAEGPLTINLADGSTNTVANSETTGSEIHGIYMASGALTIDGTGRLETTGVKSGICANNGNITINNGTVIAKGARGDTSSAGIVSYTKGITINDGEVRATGGDGDGSNASTGHGLRAETITIMGGKVIAKGGDYADSNGIFAKVSVTVENGEVTAVGGQAANNSSRGIVSNGAISFNGGTVTAQGVTMGVVADSTITISGGTGEATATSSKAACTAMNKEPVLGTGVVATGVYADKTMTWEPAPTTYTVTYDGNGATSGAAPTDSSGPYTSGATVTVLGNTGNLVKTDSNDSYTFVGWNTLSNGFGTDYKTGDTFPIAKDTTLYAKWARNPKITGGTVSASANVGAPATIYVVASGTDLTYQWQVSTDGGNTWNNVSDGTGATSAEYKTVATTTAMNGYKYRCIVKSADGGVATSTPATLTVNPAPITYTVTFDSKGGSAVTSQTVSAGGKATAPAEPTKTGYTFAGWFKDESFTTVWDFDTDTVTAAVMLYAKWTAIAHTHDWGEPTYAWSADNTACTATRICKTDSSHVETANAVVTSSQTKAPTCTEKGETTYTAAFDVDWAEQQVMTDEIPVTGHSFVNGKCTECGAADPNYVPTEPTPTPGPTDNPNTEGPKTGDNSNMMLWGMLLLAAGAGIAGVVLYGQKRATKH